MKLYERFRYFISGYYNLLLAFLILLFIFRPYNDSILYLAIWKFFLIAVFLSVIFIHKHQHRIKTITFFLAIPSVLLNWIDLLYNVNIAFISNTVSTILLMTICTSSIIRNVLVNARVTLETLKGVICAYFMVAFVFSYIYYLIEYLFPNSFHLIHRTSTLFSYSQYLCEMLYFSFITLLTVGYGDITAIKPIGQTAVVIEGIIGQFYVAILVSRFVAIYSLYRDNHSDQ